MEAVDLPIYLIACRDSWVTYGRGMPRGTICAFGSKEDALIRARAEAENEGVPAALFRVVEYRFSGNVTEG